VLTDVLTFTFFLLIGLEIREGLKHPKEIALPSLCALSGMVFPAIIFKVLHHSGSAWAVAMPTDVALAIGALALMGKRVNPAARLFLLSLAVADDFFSLVVIGIFFHSHPDLSSAIYTMGAAAIGALLPARHILIKYLAPLITYAVIPLYIWINLLRHLDFSQSGSSLSLSLIVARILGKCFGITLAAWVISKITPLKLPSAINLREVAGVGLLAGMGLTVSLVIAKITTEDAVQISQIKIGLFISALVAAFLGILWLRFSTSRFTD